MAGLRAMLPVVIRKTRFAPTRESSPSSRATHPSPQWMVPGLRYWNVPNSSRAIGWSALIAYRSFSSARATCKGNAVEDGSATNCHDQQRRHESNVIHVP